MAHDVNYAEWDFNDKHPYCEGIYFNYLTLQFNKLDYLIAP